MQLCNYNQSVITSYPLKLPIDSLKLPPYPLELQTYPLDLPSSLSGPQANQTHQNEKFLTALLQALDRQDHVVYFEAGSCEVKIGIGQLFKANESKDFDAFEVQQLNRISLKGPKPFSVTLIPYDYARALVLGVSPVAALRTIVPEILLTYNLTTKVLRGVAYLLHAESAQPEDSAEQLAILQEQCTQLVTSAASLSKPSSATLPSHGTAPLQPSHLAPGPTPVSPLNPSTAALSATSAYLPSYSTSAPPITPPLHFVASASAAQYAQGFSAAKEALHRGDVFQLVLSNTLVAQGQVDTAALCAYLIEEEASPFVVKIKLGEMTAVSATPERLVRKRGTSLETVPIAGTRPVLKDGLDHQRAQDLLNDPKERAEHLMLVDLGRNDLGRVSVPGTVNVKDYAKIKYLSRVMHLVSTVQSEEVPGGPYLGALRATLPAGTVSGAPKKKAMTLIDQLEVDSRGLYAGCFLIEDLMGNYDSLITIRTLVQEEDHITLRVGSGIVLDSTLAGESDELINKALGQLKAVEAIYPGGVTYDFDPR